MSPDNITTVHLLISGRVQGVGYRTWASKAARKLGLRGWVRNLTNGNVEAVAQGPKDAVDQFVGACQAGPMLARVTAVDTKVMDKPLPAIPDNGFNQLDTHDPVSA